MKFEHVWIQDTLDGIDVENTRVAYTKGLVMFWAWYEEQNKPNLNLNTMNRFKRFLQNKGYATSTIAIYLASVDMALKNNARPSDVIDRLDLQDIEQKLTIKRVKSDNYAVSMSGEERDKILAACSSTLIGIRDLAVLTMLFYQGFRRGEVAKLDLKNYDPNNNMLFIREGKHHKNRAVPLHPLVKERVNTWLSIRGCVAKCEAVFVSVQKRTKGQRLTGHNVYRILNKHCIKASVAPYHPHDCRSTYITMLHNNGVNIGDIQALAGHSRADTTLGYVKHDFNKLRDATLTLK